MTQPNDKQTIRAIRSVLAAENRLYGPEFVEVPPHKWPTPPPMSQDAIKRGVTRVAVFRNRFVLAQVFKELDCIRISINRTSLRSDGHFDGDFTWDELQEIKRAIGYGDRDAIEVYPADHDIVNVANMRHLWIMPEPLPIIWRNKS